MFSTLVFSALQPAVQRSDKVTKTSLKISFRFIDRFSWILFTAHKTMALKFGNERKLYLLFSLIPILGVNPANSANFYWFVFLMNMLWKNAKKIVYVWVYAQPKAVWQKWSQFIFIVKNRDIFLCWSWCSGFVIMSNQYCIIT